MQPQFKTKPYKHQLDAWLEGWERDYYAYFMEMGTGKSKVAIDDFCMNYTANKIDAVIILANNGSYRNWAETQIPTHIWDNVKQNMYVGVWKEESGEVVLDPAFDKLGRFFKIFVMNVEALAYEKGVKAATSFVKGRRAMIIVDESTTVKNKDAKRTKNVVALAQLCIKRRIMTGDPITNSPLDLFAQCAVLSRNALGYPSYFAFRNYFAVMITMKAGQRSFNKVSGYKNLSELTERLKKFSFRVKKEECLDLPPKVYQKYYVELTPEQKRVYEALREESIAELMDSEKNSTGVVTGMLAITKMVKLHQVVCGHVIDDEKRVHKLESNRIAALMDVVDEANGKIIIWANYRHDIKAIVEALSFGYGPESVRSFFGDTTDDDRVQASRDFQDGGARFMVSNQQTGGFGNTWTAAKTVIYYSNNYQIELRRQSEDRAHRIGQDKSVNYVDLVCKGTVDEKIINALRTYSKVASATLGDTWREWI